MDERDIVLNSVLEELKNKKLITELETRNPFVVKESL